MPAEVLMSTRLFLTVEQAADEIQVHPETVRRLLRTGKLRGHRLGGRKAGWRIAMSDVVAYLSGGQALPPVQTASPRSALRSSAERLGLDGIAAGIRD
jgi:excisionase family DNA binding protein